MTAAALAVLLGGCGGLFSSPVVTRLWSSVASWTENDKSGVPGIDFAAVSVRGFERPKVGETLVVVWAGLHFDHGGSGGAGGPDEFKANADMESNVPGEGVECTLTFHPDDPGTLTFADRQYNLADGTLFLVSFEKKPPLVKQLKRNLSRGQLTVAALKQLATSDSEINHFFKGSKLE